MSVYMIQFLLYIFTFNRSSSLDDWIIYANYLDDHSLFMGVSNYVPYMYINTGLDDVVQTAYPKPNDSLIVAYDKLVLSGKLSFKNELNKFPMMAPEIQAINRFRWNVLNTTKGSLLVNGESVLCSSKHIDRLWRRKLVLLPMNNVNPYCMWIVKNTSRKSNVDTITNVANQELLYHSVYPFFSFRKYIYTSRIKHEDSERNCEFNFYKLSTEHLI